MYGRNARFVEQISRLKDDLYEVRSIEIRPMSENLRSLLTDTHSCTTYEDVYVWEHITIGNVIDAADPKATLRHTSIGERAYCPLCSDGHSSTTNRAGSVFRKGFAVTWRDRTMPVDATCGQKGRDAGGESRGAGSPLPVARRRILMPGPPTMDVDCVSVCGPH